MSLMLAYGINAGVIATIHLFKSCRLSRSISNFMTSKKKMAAGGIRYEFVMQVPATAIDDTVLFNANYWVGGKQKDMKYKLKDE
ncbi:unnamed protein product [Wuchereria bancrofti]|uniref:Uncharacterized protein n=1 Tax=Wuchereria bancrofti TaxID=6293 RepID=A0A3P7FKF0_WUCBA|nr:unnamed protein product [Wuchereria bancrofti]